MSSECIRRLIDKIGEGGKLRALNCEDEHEYMHISPSLLMQMVHTTMVQELPLLFFKKVALLV